MDSRDAGAYGDTNWEDRQTGLVKKSGERWRRTDKKQTKKKRKGEGMTAIYCILFTCSFFLRPPSFLILHTHTQRQRRRVQDIRDHAEEQVKINKQKRDFSTQEPEQMAEAWCIWSPKAICNWNPSSCWQIKKEKKTCHNKMHFHEIWCSFSGEVDAKCVCVNNACFSYLYHPSCMSEIKQVVLFFFFKYQKWHHTSHSSLIPKTAPWKCPQHASIS